MKGTISNVMWDNEGVAGSIAMVCHARGADVARNWTGLGGARAASGGRCSVHDRPIRLAGGSARSVTAYVANSGSGTVTPITTATNTAGPPITVGATRTPSRSRRTARPPTSSTRLGHGDPDRDRHQHRRAADHGRQRPLGIAITPDGKTAYVANTGSGTVTPIATATNTAGPPITVGSDPWCDRDHAGRQDRLRRQRRLGHGDPDRDRHQHRRAADHGRKQPPMPSRSRRTARPPTSPTTLGHGDPDRDRHQHRRPADHGRQRTLCHRDHAGRQDRLRRQPAARAR